MRPAYENDTDQRLARLEDRDRETVSQLAANMVMLTALGHKVTEGFATIADRLDQLGATLQTHGHQLKSLTETRDRQRSIGRWVGGIVSAVVVAALVMVLGLVRR